MKFLPGTRGRVAITSLLGLGMLATVIAGCGSQNGTSGTGSTSGGKGCKNVGILLPESATAARWEAADHPDLVAAIKKDLPGAKVTEQNANGNAATQQTQADAMLNSGTCILVVGPYDSAASATIVTKAKAKGVPVISYDRLIQSPDIAAEVTFNAVKVGEDQAQYIADHYQQYAVNGQVPNVVMINGGNTDNNAINFAKGAHNVLDPLFNSGKLKKVYEKFTPGWDNGTAQTEMQAALTANHNNIQIAYVANDGMANTVIAALKQAGLNGKVLVTGQDAETSGIHNILAGDQSMTIYKPIQQEADNAAKVVAALSNGTSVTSIATQTDSLAAGGTVPAVLLQPIAVDKTNIKSTVIADGFQTAAAVCQGIPAGTDGVC